ncbi:hypothetical protein BDK92_2973 [Micromonospora pisi]|uniref:Uncharacterized protein n=1 Tax=Micromonospora pisi TaxID=589240 RepID=A0A495JJS7_9ACTN|nr:hypothetical protein [Micromonospora pisi]RKR88644.1 hypothetical protein BDK92_2973 [Micromonospora pisi]
MSVTPQTRDVPEAPVGLVVTYAGTTYPAEELTRGAAYELFSASEVDGFSRDPRPDARLPWHRFVHASEVTAVYGSRAAGDPDLEPPLTAPLNRVRNWDDVHQLSQTQAGASDPILASVRNSALVRQGTPMVKVLSARQFAGHLRGWLPYGFCYREYDVAHLRTPADLALLRTDLEAGRDGTDVAYVLRWRAIDPLDYDVPGGDRHAGLVAIPPHDRVGPPVLGTGFTPSGRHLIPEFVTRDMADLPLSANAALVAYSPAGDEVVLYTYQPEQRGWLRMAGPRWRHLLAAAPGVSPDQDYVPFGDTPRSTQLVGDYHEQEYEALADLPGGFRVLAMTRAARYPVENVRRRARYANWRGVLCLVLGEQTGWLRLRLCRPNPDSIATCGAQCYERGVYESWAPAQEITDDRMIDLPYGR